MSGFKHNKTGRSTSKQSGRKGRGNRPPPGESFGWLTRDMLESPAWRALSINARRVLDRLIVEHLAHAGTENGNLICTFDDLEGYGVTRRLIRTALLDLRYYGWLHISHGEPNGAHRPPNLYRLTWLGYKDDPATNNWKGVTEDHVKARNAQKRGRRKTERQCTKVNQTQCTKVNLSPKLKIVK